ncbi:hypothetical protein AB0K21_43465 [Streptosporangium sp. NPDC049248]|uniref:hypothetical protein n=1 Tax=Streptosporangium sp. NPDC049248 TaxID=3155651 RepID=UPI003413D930
MTDTRTTTGPFPVRSKAIGVPSADTTMSSVRVCAESCFVIRGLRSCSGTGEREGSPELSAVEASPPGVDYRRVIVEG